jgi:hypothetical protein
LAMLGGGRAAFGGFAVVHRPAAPSHLAPARRPRPAATLTLTVPPMTLQTTAALRIRGRRPP